MQVFVEGIRTAEKSLKDLTAQTSAYQHFWTVHTPVATEPPARGGVAPGSTPDVTRDLENQVSRLREALRTQQSNFDRRLAAANRDSQNGSGKGSGQGSGQRRGGARGRSRSDRRGNGGGQGGKDRRGGKGRDPPPRR